MRFYYAANQSERKHTAHNAQRNKQGGGSVQRNAQSAATAQRKPKRTRGRGCSVQRAKYGNSAAQTERNAREQEQLIRASSAAREEKNGREGVSADQLFCVVRAPRVIWRQARERCARLLSIRKKKFTAARLCPLRKATEEIMEFWEFYHAFLFSPTANLWAICGDARCRRAAAQWAPAV